MNMTDDRLRELLAAFGSDPACFPDDEKDAAAALLAAHPERFAEFLGAERDLDALLRELPEVTPSPALVQALIASGPSPTRQATIGSGKRWWPFGMPLAGAMASLMVGLGAGFSFTPVYDTDTIAITQESDETDTLVMAALGMDQDSMLTELEDE